MSYTNKLEKFNSSQKYRSEIAFLEGLIASTSYTFSNILDFGCGNGFTAIHLKAAGYTKIQGYDKEQHNPLFQYISPGGNWDLVYFMHSFAHIENIQQVLEELDCSAVVVITPNKSWMLKQYNKEYQPDPTVIQHYTQLELIAIFEAAGYTIENVGQFGAITENRNERIFLKASK